MKTKCCCMRERLTNILRKLVDELEETSVDDFTKLRPLTDKAEALLKEASPMIGHSCAPRFDHE